MCCEIKPYRVYLKLSLIKWKSALLVPNPSISFFLFFVPQCSIFLLFYFHLKQVINTKAYTATPNLPDWGNESTPPSNFSGIKSFFLDVPIICTVL